MSVLATDDFAGTGALSGNWTVDQGAAARVSGECALTDTATGQVTVRYTGVTTPNDHYAKVTIGGTVETVSDSGAGPMVRAQDSSNFYFLQGNTSETKVFSKVGGSFTQLGSNGPSITTGDVLYLEVQGTTIIAKKNGSSICGSPITDSGLSSGKGGIWSGPDNSSVVLTVDNFEVGDFSGGGATTITPSAGSLALTGVAAVKIANTFLTPTVGALTLAGAAPTLTLTIPAPDSGSLTLTGNAPTVVRGTVIVPTVGALAFSGNSPVVSQSGAAVIQPGTGSLTLSGIASAVITNTFRVPTAGALTLTGIAPTVVTIGSVTIQPLAGALVLSGTPAQLTNSLIPNVRPHRHGHGFGFR